MSGRVKLGARLLLAAIGTGSVSCGGSDQARAQPIEETAVTLGSENIVVVDSVKFQSGPVISGTLTADREAKLRAQITAEVRQTLVEPGQRVGSGTLLMRLESSNIREAYVSAQSGVRSAEANLDVVRRNFERAQRLSQAGAVAQRDVETAQSQLTSAEAAVADAKARLASAERQLANTEIHAPFAGVVSERPANTGDIVQNGTALVTVVDPSSMRLEASVAADRLSAIRVSAPVDFTVTGYQGQVFTGLVDRINPAADPATGQVRINVKIPNTGRALVSGLYAEGRVATRSGTGLAIPLSALSRQASKSAVSRVRGGRVELVEVQTGIEDDVAELVEVTGGLAKGDTLLLAGAQGLAPGTHVRVTATATAPGGEH